MYSLHSQLLLQSILSWVILFSDPFFLGTFFFSDLSDTIDFLKLLLCHGSSKSILIWQVLQETILSYSDWSVTNHPFLSSIACSLKLVIVITTCTLHPVSFFSPDKLLNTLQSWFCLCLRGYRLWKCFWCTGLAQTWATRLWHKCTTWD